MEPLTTVGPTNNLLAFSNLPFDVGASKYAFLKDKYYLDPDQTFHICYRASKSAGRRILWILKTDFEAFKSGNVRPGHELSYTCWTGVDFHHNSVNLWLRELELVQELEGSLFGPLQLVETFRDGLVVLPLVVDRVGQDEAQVEGWLPVKLALLGPLPTLKTKRETYLKLLVNSKNPSTNTSFNGGFLFFKFYIMSWKQLIVPFLCK